VHILRLRAREESCGIVCASRQGIARNCGVRATIAPSRNACAPSIAASAHRGERHHRALRALQIIAAISISASSRGIAARTRACAPRRYRARSISASG